jgi:serine phosphatase RsbU (regulator of sigma subunit)/Tfp pilus assembly protein PilF
VDKIYIIILALGCILHSNNSISQNNETVLSHYDRFLDLEFNDPDAAFSSLQKGLNEAILIGDNNLIGIGYKYTSWYYQDIENLSEALRFSDSSIVYAEKAQDEFEMVNTYNQKGNLLSDMALLDSSLIYYNQALNIAKANNDQAGIAKVANNLGLVYMDQGDYLEAIDNFHLSIQKSEEIDDQESVGDAYNNLGTLFTQFEDYEQALFYHQKAYEIRKDGDDPLRLSSVVLNIGRIYLTQNQLDSARSCFFQSLAIDQDIDDKYGIALNYNNIGLSYFLDENLDSALFYYNASLEMRIALDDPFGMALSYNNLGDFYYEIKDYSRSVDNCMKAYVITTIKDLPYEKQSACDCLYRAYEKKGDINQAFKFLKESIDLQGQLISESNTKELTKKEMEFVFHFKELEDSLKQAEILAQKEFQIKSAELEKERVSSEKRSQLWLFSVIGFFLAVIGGIIYVQLRRQRKKNQIIKEKNAFIKAQKHEIDQSISYAQKIQDTSLPSKELTNLFSDSFLIYLPRDIVSGDFYWLENNEEYTYFAVADCTGHGIPGAFISMIGTILLNEIHNSKKILDPGEILDELNRLIQLTLLSRTGKQMKDGMDISFCRLDKKTMQLQFAGANNPVWIISKSETLVVNGTELAPDLQGTSNLFEVKADKQPIGKYIGEDRSFNSHTIQLQGNDQIYLFTDGYADQFGGERGKKFKYKPFKQLLVDTAHLNCEDQRLELTKTFDNWKGDYDQIDDVTVMGVRV